MRESIKDKVSIIGVGCTKFAERWDADVEDLIKEAVDEALADAGVEIKDIQAGWVGTGRGSQQVNMGPRAHTSQARLCRHSISPLPE